MQAALTNSVKFLIFWVFLIVGLAVGSKIDVPTITLAWLGGLWLVIFLSDQEDRRIELVSIALFAGTAGALIWQLTGGEVWLRLSGLSFISERLISLRDLLIDRIFLSLPEPHGSLLAGILFGNRLKLDRELLETFRIVGLSHLIAVSGFNLTILTANAQTFFRGIIGRNSLWLGLVIIFFFIIITGAPASILRAGVMASVVIIAQIIGRPSQSLNLLILASGVLAVFEPKIIFDVGFQLSVVATYGLISLAPLIGQALRGVPAPKSLKGILAETLSATILTAPLIILHFERLALVSPLTNMLVLPIIPLLMALGLTSAAVLLISPAIGGLLVMLTWPLLSWVLLVGDWFSQLAWSATEASLNHFLIAAIMALIVLAVEFLGRFVKPGELDYLDELFLSTEPKP